MRMATTTPAPPPATGRRGGGPLSAVDNAVRADNRSLFVRLTIIAIPAAISRATLVALANRAKQPPRQIQQVDTADGAQRGLQRRSRFENLLHTEHGHRHPHHGTRGNAQRNAQCRATRGRRSGMRQQQQIGAGDDQRSQIEQRQRGESRCHCVLRRREAELAPWRTGEQAPGVVVLRREEHVPG